MDRGNRLCEPLIPEVHVERLASSTKTAFEVARLITAVRTPIYLYGGMVRNLLLQVETILPDYDFIGDFDLDYIENSYPELVVKRNDEISTIKLRIGAVIYDFTAAKDLKERLAMNDMTISTICFGSDRTIVDPFGGLESLKKKEIKIIDPMLKINSDPSRILRVFRFAVELGFSIENNTFQACVQLAHLLGESNCTNELWKILSLDYEKKFNALRSLQACGISDNLAWPDGGIGGSVITSVVENEVRKRVPLAKLRELFEAEIYLAGGSIRDLIWGKEPKDFDFKVSMSVVEMLETLESEGFVRTYNRDVKEGQYYLNEIFGAIRVVIDSVDVDLTQMSSTQIEDLVDQGDINFSCCVYNLKTDRIENPEVMGQIRRKELYFCNSSRALDDPLIVINALKQISRLPDIVVPEETRQIILQSMLQIVNLLDRHPELTYKVASVCDNLCSEEVYGFFESVVGGLEILKSLDLKRRKLSASPQYCSMPIEELTDADRHQVERLIKLSYGRGFDESKLFTPNINSIVLQKEGEEVTACCLVDGERLYAAAARDSSRWLRLVTDLVRNNYNVWCTVDCNNPKIQALCTLAGLKIENDPSVIRRILETKSRKYDDVLLFRQNGMTVFQKSIKDNYPQVLLRS